MRGRDKTPRLVDTLARDWLTKRQPTPPSDQDTTHKADQVPTPDQDTRPPT